MAVSISPYAGHWTATGTSITIGTGLPSLGDLMVLIIGKDDDVATTDDSGEWTKLTGFESNNAIWLDIYYKVADAGDTSNANYTFSGDSEDYIAKLHYATGSNNTPILLSSISDIGTDAAPTTGAYTASDAGCGIIAGFINDSDSTGQAVDSALTESLAVAGSGSGGVGAGAGYYIPGTTSIPSLTHSFTPAEQWIAFVVEIPPLPGPTGSGGITADAPTIDGAGGKTGNIIGSGGVTADAPNVDGAGSISTGATGSGGVTADAPNVDGAGTVAPPNFTTETRLTQQAIAVLHQSISSDVKVSQQAVVVLHENRYQLEARVTQQAVAVLHKASSANTEARVAQQAVAVLHKATSANTDARVAQQAVAVLHANNYSTPTSADARVSQAPIQVLLKESTPEVQVSQAPIQVLLKESAPEVQVSQAPIQVLLTEAASSVSEAQVSQAPIQVLLKESAPEVQVSQAPIQVLLKYLPLPGVINFTICYEDGSAPTGDFDYVMLLGTDAATATFIEAGIVTITDGDGYIAPSSGEIRDDIILVLQYGDMIGAYEGILQ